MNLFADDAKVMKNIEKDDISISVELRTGHVTKQFG